MDALLGLVIVAFFYFLPIILGRKKRRATALFWLNLLGGWTGLGWIIAFIWALTKDATASEVPSIPPITATPLSRSIIARTTSSPASVPDSPPQVITLAPTTPPSFAQLATRNLAAELERLFQLKENGALTEEEYANSKTKLLA